MLILELFFFFFFFQYPIIVLKFSIVKRNCTKHDYSFLLKKQNKTKNIILRSLKYLQSLIVLKLHNVLRDQNYCHIVALEISHPKLALWSFHHNHVCGIPWALFVWMWGIASTLWVWGKNSLINLFRANLWTYFIIQHLMTWHLGYTR